MRMLPVGRNWLIGAVVLIAIVLAATSGALRLGDDAPMVQGIVVSASGAPIPGAQITTPDGASADADGSGRFRVEAESGWVTARADGWLPRTRAAGPDSSIVVRLARDRPGTVSFAFGGDVMFGRRYFDPDEDGEADDGLLELDSGVDDHLELLDGVRPLLDDTDVTVVNLESPLAEDPYSSPTEPRPATFHPTKEFVFASRPAAAEALREAGVDVVGIGNNHLFDRLESGVASTRTALEGAGFQPGRGLFGAGASADEAWEPAVLEVEGQRVAMVGCTSITGEEHAIDYVASADKGGAAECDPRRLRSAVAAAAARADIVVAMIHGGFEYERDPSAQVRALSDAAVEAGATMVINHQAHVVGGLRFEAGTLTAWTLGNLLFDQTVWPTFESYVLRVATHRGEVVSAWIEPIRLQEFKPTGVFGEDAEWVAKGAFVRSEGPWVVDDGSLWLDVAGESRVERRAATSSRLTRVDVGCSPDAGRELLWTGDFEDHDLASTAGVPLWNVDDDDDHRVAGAAAARRGARGVRLRRSGGDRQDALLTPLHRILVEAGSELTMLVDHREVSGPVDAVLQLSWYNDTSGGSQAQTIVPLSVDDDWQRTRVDVRVPGNAVAVQPFLRLRPSQFAQSILDVDDVRLIAWGELGCDFLRRRSTVQRRALPPFPAEPEIAVVEAEPVGVEAPVALPQGPIDDTGGLQPPSGG